MPPLWTRLLAAASVLGMNAVPAFALDPAAVELDELQVSAEGRSTIPVPTIAGPLPNLKTALSPSCQPCRATPR